MREQRDTDFFIELPDVGEFRYGRRTFGDRLAIRAAYLHLVKGTGDDDPDLSMYAGFASTHAVLCVDAPEGWADILGIDLTAPGDPDAKIFDLFTRLREMEDSFTKGVTKSVEVGGEG